VYVAWSYEISIFSSSDDPIRCYLDQNLAAEPDANDAKSWRKNHIQQRQRYTFEA
jgi:hypothetical protein